ncbi:Glycine-rich domain-containing protein 1 [Bienertia sinuspersici]
MSHELYGRVLGNHNIISSTKGTRMCKTKEICNTMYHGEPYELDHNRKFPIVSQKSNQGESLTDYDLVSAVRRQDSFYYQGKQEEELKKNYVLTYDVDLMWHSNQLHPVSCCNDLIKLLGKVLGHDDTDSDKTKKGKNKILVSQVPQTSERRLSA